MSESVGFIALHFIISQNKFISYDIDMLPIASYSIACNLPSQNSFFVINNYLVITVSLLSRMFAVATQYHRTKSEIEAEYQIILSAQKNPQHFAPIYERYFESIFVYVNKRVENEDISGDITAKVFYNCLNSLSKYRFQGVPFSAWLYKIALNEINQFFRQRKETQRIVSINDSHIDLLIVEMEREEPEIDKHVLISVLLEQLDPYEVQFLELRFFEDNSFKKIGYLLGITEVNAKVKTYRILDKLRKLSKEIKFH